MDWDIFFDPKNIKLDEPNKPVIEVYKALRKQGATMIIMSGRDARSIEETRTWLANHGIVYHHFMMRPENDFTPDSTLKKDFLSKLIEKDIIKSKSDITCVFDDRKQVKRMWVEQGLFVMDVNQTDDEF